MRTLVREHAKWLWAAFIGFFAVSSGLTIFVPQLPTAMKDFWLIAWIWVPVSIGLIIRLLQANDMQYRSHERLADSNSSLRNDLAVAKEVDAESAHLRSKLAEARARVAELEIPEPTERDRTLFAKILHEWPWNEGTLWWLEHVFNAKQWSSSIATQVVIYADVERETYFDNSTVNASYEQFKVACNKLSVWLILESFPHRQSYDVQEIPDGSNRAGGWPEFDALRREGRTLADAVVNSRRELERVARSQGL